MTTNNATSQGGEIRILSAPEPHWVGNGFHARSIFSYSGVGAELSPFLLFDYAGPTVFEAGTERLGVGRHPHKGFETVTIVYEGELEHRDSGGGGGIIGPGDVQWMTAGKGILHEEYHSPAFRREGGVLQMVQLWVNLRAKDKNVEPAYQTLRATDIPSLPLAGQAGNLRLIAGEFLGSRGAAKTHSPVDLWDISLRRGAEVSLPLEASHSSALFVIDGSCSLNGGRAVTTSQLAILPAGASEVRISASRDCKLLYMGGEPLNDPVVGYGPFVMNTREEIADAMEQFRM